MKSNVAFFFTGSIFLLSCVNSPRQFSIQEEIVRESEIRRLLTEGTSMLKEGNVSGLAKAKASFLLAKELKHNDHRILDALGSVAWYQDEIELAKFYFKAAIKADPRYDRAYAHLALVAEAENDKQAARELLQLAISYNPLNYRARNNLAVLNLSSVQGQEDLPALYEELLKVYVQIGDDPIVKHNLELIRGELLGGKK